MHQNGLATVLKRVNYKIFEVNVSNCLIILLLVKFCCVNENHNDLSELSGSASCGATNVSQKGSVLPVLSEKLFAWIACENGQPTFSTQVMKANGRLNGMSVLVQSYANNIGIRRAISSGNPDTCKKPVLFPKHFSLAFRHENTLKSIFPPLFGVCSTQTLVQIYNTYHYSWKSSYLQALYCLNPLHLSAKLSRRI